MTESGECVRASANMALVAPLAAHAVGQVSLSISNVSQAEYRWSRGDLPIIPLLSNKASHAARRRLCETAGQRRAKASHQ